jgi:hypothetical protein
METAPALANFRKSFPIDFSLLDQHDQAVIYISEDTEDWELHLTITNTSSQSITMIDGSGATSGTNHHFALRFHPGTLAKRAIDLLSGDKVKEVLKTTDWELAKLSSPAPNAKVTLYLRYTGKDKTLKHNESRSIMLSGISAAPGSGSRGTQVEMIPHQLKFDGEAGAAITNSRTQYLHVTNHAGRKHIPLHVGFAGGNRVLTEAVDAHLKLRVTNVFKAKDVRQSTITFRGGETQLTLSYDKGNEEWELGTAIGAVKVVNKAKTLNLIGKPDKEESRPGWVIAFNQDFHLNYGESFDIEISGIAVASKGGHANLYLHYQNIPGYWEGQFVCAVQKGPVMFKHHNVGIGLIPDEKSKLQIAGGTRTTSLTLTGGPSSPGQPSGAGTIRLGNGSLELGWSADQARPANASKGWIQTYDAPLAINPLGNNIVLGNPAMPATVEVNGDLKVKGRITAEQGVWKDVECSGFWRAFTSVASMKDENGVVHLRGLLFVPSDAKTGDFICRLDSAHRPTDSDRYLRIVGLNSRLEYEWHGVQVCGTNKDMAGWIRVESFRLETPKLISLDFVKIVPK